MTYLPKEGFSPVPNFEDQDFWKSCSQRELRFQACADCGSLRHPPTPICWNCQSTRTTWKQAPEQGSIFTYTVVHHSADERISKAVPYVVALIEFPEFGPVKLVSNVMADPATIKIGMSVTLVWEEGAEGTYLPRFTPSES